MFFMYRCFAQSAITYAGCNGRFGDQLTCYIHAKWVSYKYGFTLLYKPFIYSDQLMLHEKEITSCEHLQINKTVHIPRNQFITFSEDNALYVLPYFSNYPKSNVEAQRAACPFVVDWHDYKFLDLLKGLISPKQSLELLKLSPKNLNVALHIRTGGSFDKMWHEQADGTVKSKEFSDVALPLNHPREEFYCKQLAWLISLFKNKKIYVYIFTDDNHPEILYERYRAAVDDPNITFDFRKINNNCESYVLQDFFFMQKFDCIICPNSNYSIIASKIGDNAITIFPVAYEWHDANLIITKVKVDVKLRELQLLIDRQLLPISELSHVLVA